MALAYDKPPYQFTVCEYLTFERTAAERHEYLDGVIYAMAEESRNHGHICTNLTRLLATQLRGSPCAVFGKYTKVRAGPAQADTRQGLWSYPDLLVVCGEPQYHDAIENVLINPCLILEVLSPSTQAFDRGAKWDRYRTLVPCLEDYVLVSQDRPAIEHWHKQPDGTWQAVLREGLEAVFELTRLGCVVPLGEVYERVVFPLS